MVDEPVADTNSNWGGGWAGEQAAGPGPEAGHCHPAGVDVHALTAELAAAVKAREDALNWVRELEAAVRERDGLISELRTGLKERDGRIDELAERLERTQVRIADVERSLDRTVELQRSLEAEFDRARHMQDQTASVLAATRDVTDRGRAELAERDALIRQLQAEAARRGAPGTPAAVGTALADLIKAAKRRRLERLAVEQPWRLPPGARR